MTQPRHRSHAKVLACLNGHEIRIRLLPGAGMVDGGIDVTVSDELVPASSKLPNALVWVTWASDIGVVSVEPRTAEDDTPMF